MSAADSCVGPVLGASAGQRGEGSISEDASSDTADPARSYVGPLRGVFAARDADLAVLEKDRPAPAKAEPARGPAGSLRRPARLPAEPAPAATGSSSPDYADILDTVHAPTIKVMHQLRQARHRLHRAALPELGLSPAIRALLRTEQRLGRPVRLAICGEVNAGKSSLANLLAGIESLPTAVTINTLIPTLLYYAREPEIWAVQPGGKRERLRSNGKIPRDEAVRIEVGLPSPRLAAMQVLDLPGFSASRWSEPFFELSSHHVDAIIWCTVSTQAWKESERSAWSMLPRRLAARGLLVATHSDLLRRAEDSESLMARLQHEVGNSFMDILPLATLDAIAVMGDGRRGDPAWVASGAKALETALGSLLATVREQRAAAAQAVTSRIAQRALARLESQFGSP